MRPLQTHRTQASAALGTLPALSEGRCLHGPRASCPQEGGGLSPRARCPRCLCCMFASGSTLGVSSQRGFRRCVRLAESVPAGNCGRGPAGEACEGDRDRGTVSCLAKGRPAAPALGQHGERESPGRTLPRPRPAGETVSARPAGRPRSETGSNDHTVGACAPAEEAVPGSRACVGEKSLKDREGWVFLRPAPPAPRARPQVCSEPWGQAP